MKEIVDFLTSANIMDLATDPRVLFLTLVVVVAAVIMRWKFVLLLLFGVGGILAVVRYSRLGAGEAALDRHLVVFAGGAFLVVAVLIYFLFVKGD
ncbi:MAG: hypothetical protein HZA60_05855 [Deltaproteobacteria bacterium]|nr:hypothetical protein [Deltaproteobacteria bacterium]